MRQRMMLVRGASRGNSGNSSNSTGTSSSSSISSSGGGSGGGGPSQLVVGDGESWERWWAVERVLLLTIRNSGQRMAQYIGGHRVNKQHRNSGSGSGSGSG